MGGIAIDARHIMSTTSTSTPETVSSSHVREGEPARIPQLSDVLRRGDDGIWRAARQSDISHPEVCQDWYREVEDRSYWYRHRAACITDLMERFPPGGAVFDIGGGNGSVSLAMKRAGHSPVLVEPSLSAARNARHRGLRDVICSTLQDAGFHAGVLPAAGMFDVLEHIEDDRQFLTDLGRSLTPQGRLYLTVPAYSWLWSEHDERVGHYRRYTRARICRLLRETGYEVEYAAYLFAALTAPVLFMRALPYRIFGPGRSNQHTFAREHACSGGLLSRGIHALFAVERYWSRYASKMPLGTSCVVVARKLPKVLR